MLKIANKKVLILALVLAAAASFGVYQFISKTDAAATGRMVAVVVAAMDIPANKAISKEMLSVRDIPQDYDHPQALGSVEQAVGKTSKVQMLKGEQVLASKVASKDEPGNRFSYHIPANQRAMTVAVTEVTGIAGLPTVGDRVDVLLAGGKDDQVQAETVLQNKEILATGGVIFPQEDGTQRIVPTITLSVTPEEAQQLALAETNGKIRLTLRPLSDKQIVTYEYSKKRQLPLSSAGGEHSARKAKIISVFSNKGGVGKSTLAVNLAVTMAKNFQVKTLLWDLDLYHGVVTVATGINQRVDVTDMLNEIQHLDKEQLESFLEKHESGLKILSAPFTPEFADYVSGDHVSRILGVAREAWDYIVVDTPPVFSETTLEALKQSDVVLLVGSLDMGTVKNLKACLMILDKLNFPRGRLKLILNRVGREFGISSKDLEDTLQMSVFATLPADAKNVVTGLNQGVPVAYSLLGSDFGRSIQLLAKSLLGTSAVEQSVQKKGLLGRLIPRTS